MPESKTYIVRQVREIEVTANDAMGALAHGLSALMNYDPPPTTVWGNPHKATICETELTARERRYGAT